MRINGLFLIPAAVAGYFFSYLSEKRPVPPETALPHAKTASPEPVERIPVALAESKPAEIAVPASRREAERPSVAKSFENRSRARRIGLLLEVFSDCDTQELKSNFEETLKAFKNGMLERSDLSLVCEALGGRCDAGLIVDLLRIPGVHPDFQQSMFKGWAGSDPRGAASALMSGKFNSDKNFPTREAFEGVVSGIDGEAAELNQIRKKFHQAITLLETVSATADARKFGISQTSQSQIKLLLSPEAADDKVKSVISFRLGVLADVAGGIDDETFLKYIDTSINSGTGLGLGSFSMMKKLAQRDPAKAWNYGLTLPSGDTRTNVLSSAISEAGKTDPDAAIKFVTDMPAGSKTEQEMIIRNLEGAFRQSPAVDKAELPALIEQTQALIQQLRAK